MRTTLTLDDDLAQLLKTQARERDQPFKQVVNEAIRAGLHARVQKPKPYKMTPGNVSLKPGIEITNRLLDEMDAEEFLRKMQRGE